MFVRGADRDLQNSRNYSIWEKVASSSYDINFRQHLLLLESFALLRLCRYTTNGKGFSIARTYAISIGFRSWYNSTLCQRKIFTLNLVIYSIATILWNYLREINENHFLFSLLERRKITQNVCIYIYIYLTDEVYIYAWWEFQWTLSDARNIRSSCHQLALRMGRIEFFCVFLIS